MRIFTDPLHDEFGTWILGFAPYGGGDVGEVELPRHPGEGGRRRLVLRRLLRLAPSRSSPRRRGRRRRSRPDRTRLLPAGVRPTSASATTRCTARRSTPVWSTRSTCRWTPSPRRWRCRTCRRSRWTIPYEGTHDPGLVPAQPARPHDVLPTILVGGGWDSTMVENHLGMGVAALAPRLPRAAARRPRAGQAADRRGPHAPPRLGAGRHPGGRRRARHRRRRRRPARLPAVEPRRLHGAPCRGASSTASPRSSPTRARWTMGGKIVAGIQHDGPDRGRRRPSCPALDPEFAAGALQVIQSNRALTGRSASGASGPTAAPTCRRSWPRSAVDAHARRSWQIVTTPIAGHLRRRRPGLDRRRPAVRRAARPEGPDPLHRRRGRRACTARC